MTETETSPVLYSAERPEWLDEFCALPEMQRLKHVGMNCGCEYTSFPRFRGLPKYSRYRHSVGAALIIWHFTGSMAQTLAGLFHDIATPVFAHTVETINKTIRVSRQLLQELGHDPSAEEIAKEMDMPVDKVRDILKIAQEPVSLETPIGEEEDSHLGDFIPDEDASEPSEAASFSLLREQLEEVHRRYRRRYQSRGRR